MKCKCCGNNFFYKSGVGDDELCERCSKDLDKAHEEWEMSKQTAITVKWCKKILKAIKELKESK